MSERVKPCPACHSSNTAPGPVLYDWVYTGEGPFDYRHCLACGAIFAAQALLPAEQERYYPVSYAAYASIDAESRLRRMARGVGLAKRCRVVERLGRKGRLLDIGCGTGAFLEAIQAHGWQVMGLERDPGAAAIARNRGLDVRTGDVSSFQCAQGSFEVITLWDVLEHLDQPEEAIQRMARWLAPEGCLVLRTPDASSVQARVAGRWWAGYDAPRHRVVYTWQGLVALLARCGLAPARVSGPTGSYALAVLSAQNWALASHWPDAVVRALGSPIVQAALWLPAAALDRLVGGAELNLIARKSQALAPQNHPKE